MRYVALLRGINVGGKAKVPMPELRAAVDALGCTDVVTHLNTGNVVLTAAERSRPKLVERLEAAITEAFGLEVKVLLRTGAEVAAVAEAMAPWVVDGQRCEALFLAPAFDRPSVVEEFPVNPEVEEVRYVKGAVLWRLDKSQAGRSRVRKLIGTELYANASMRSAGTVRTLAELATGGADPGTSPRRRAAGRG